MGKKPAAPCYVLGVGMTKFIKPRGKVDYTELGFEAGVKAMLDAQINYDDVEQGIACYCYGDSTCGQRVFYQFGMTQIPIYNVNNNCSTGSTGLYLGRTMVSNGAADCVLVVGFEKMFPGSLQSFFQDRTNPTGTTSRSTEQRRRTLPRLQESTTSIRSVTPTRNSRMSTLCSKSWTRHRFTNR
jgi:sterol carrier protein 2